MSSLRVGVLAYPGCFASEVYGVPDLLAMAGRVAAARELEGTEYETCVVSPRGRVTATGGAALDVAALRPVEVLIVPGFPLPQPDGLDAALGALGPEVAAIRAHADGGGAVVSICVGAFLLGEAGLLTGREATTAWLFADRLARRYEGVRLRPERLVVTDRGVTTTAAFSAMYDFALHLVRENDGPQVARSTARVALLDDARSTQAPYVDAELMPTTGRGFSHGVMRWLDRNLGVRYDLTVLAQEFHVSTRTLLRRFREETGQSPLTYLHKARARRAGHLLETTDRTVVSIAQEAGYRDVGTFSAVFARHMGRTPAGHRAAFRRG